MLKCNNPKIANNFSMAQSFWASNIKLKQSSSTNNIASLILCKWGFVKPSVICSWIFWFSNFSDSVLSRRWQDSMAGGKRRRLSQVWGECFQLTPTHKFEACICCSGLHVCCSSCYAFVVLVGTYMFNIIGCSVFFRTWLGFKEPWGLYLLLDSHSFCRFCLQICFSQRRIQEVLKHAP